MNTKEKKIMINSMTGYSSINETINGYEVKIELRSINSRFLDIHIKSGQLNFLQEKKIRDLIKKYLKRGRIDLKFSIKRESEEEIPINKSVVENYIKSLNKISQEKKIKPIEKISELLALPGIFKYEEDENQIKEIFEESLKLLEDSILNLMEMRKEEGKNLSFFIMEKIKFIEEKLSFIEEKSSEIFNTQFQKVRERLEKIISTKNMDEKIILEISAIAADRFDISEEIDRLKSHLYQFKIGLKNEENEPIGKKLDFLIQEMNREINTILSKTDLKEIKRLGIEIKAELEKIREQVQNIE